MIQRSLWLVALLLLAIAAPVRADCVSEVTSPVPQDGAVDVPRNARVVLHVKSQRPPDWRGASSGFRFVPRGRGRAIDAVVVEEHPGALSDEHVVVIAPASDLAASTEYALGGRAARAHRVRLTFRTGSATDVTTPAITAAIGAHFERVPFGCGPIDELPVTVTTTGEPAYARFRIAASEADAAARRFTHDVVVELHDGVAALGHGMCGGNYPLEPGDRLVAEVSVLDLSFNESAPVRTILEAR